MEQNYQWKGGDLTSWWIQDGENLCKTGFKTWMTFLTSNHTKRNFWLYVSCDLQSQKEHYSFWVHHNKQPSHKRWVQHRRKVSLLLKISEKNSEFWRQSGKILVISSEKYVLLCLLVEWLCFTRMQLSGGPSLTAHIQATPRAGMFGVLSRSASGFNFTLCWKPSQVCYPHSTLKKKKNHRITELNWKGP